jgi:basic membrane lipoprotein Med (substrate-binding protein (PBP1-ABC) superfamily)
MAATRALEHRYNVETVSPSNHARVGLVIILFAAAFACREADEPSDAFTVRLLTTLPVTGRWELAAEEGLGRISAELGAEVVRLRSAGGAQRRQRLIDAGTLGVDLVFCVGPGFENELHGEAPAYPGTRFVLLPGRTRADNVASIDFVPEGAAYIAGVVAARLRDAKVVGILRGPGSDWLQSLEAGFVTGFQSVRPRAELAAVAWPEGPWELVAAGAEVALYATDDPLPRVLAMAHDAGLLLVSTEERLLAAEPDLVAAALRVDVAEAMLRVAREVRDGSFSGSVYSFDLGSGVLDIALNDSVPDTNMPAMREALELARSEVTAGLVEMERLGF